MTHVPPTGQPPHSDPYQSSAGQEPYQGAHPQGGYEGAYQGGAYQGGAYQAPAQGGYQQDGYQQGAYQGAYAAPQAYYAPPSPAEKASQTSLVLGIVGLFTIGIILGPLAIMKANEAERGGADATAGKVLGWITTIVHALGVLGIGIMILTMFSFVAAVS